MESTVTEPRLPGSGLQSFFLGNYPPRNCGIATFTYDLSIAIGREIGDDSFGVIAMNNRIEGYDYPKEVVFEINQESLQDYRMAAEYINLSRAKLVCMQHEFGIFGGPEGSHVLHLMSALKKPIFTTLHTVLKNPTPRYNWALREVCQLSHRVVVMSKMAVDLLQEVYRIPEKKIRFIPHGIPDVPFVDPNYYKDKFQVEGRTVLLTFGLLNPNKGIETVLEALPQVVERHPDLVYIVLGATHPEVKRRSGEQYRIGLERQVRGLGLSEHVIFHNRFVGLDELCEFIGSCDMYVTPYLNKEQIASGTLAYAMGMGKAVISTPYWYAQEMLADGRGQLVDFGDRQGLEQAIIQLIEDEPKRHYMRKKAYELGRKMIWKEVAREYLELLEEGLQTYVPFPEYQRLAARRQKRGTLPAMRLDHLITLTDYTGPVQHARYGIPDRDHGYSTDDVGRGLAVVLMYYNQHRDPQALELAKIYLAFLGHAQLENGHFHNFMDFSRHFLDLEGSEDTFGRALWGLGVAVQLGPNENFRAFARQLFDKAISGISLHYPRSMAYAICGMHAFLQRYPGARGIWLHLDSLANELVRLYRKNRQDDWEWFEPAVTYGNAKLPHALLLAHEATQKKEYLKVALESLDFLTRIQYDGNIFDLVGNEGWYQRGGERAVFGQQAIDAGYLVEAYMSVYQLTAEEKHLELAEAAFEWFLGRNRLKAPLYDFETAACADGLDAEGVNMNRGAESTICFLLALLALVKESVYVREDTAAFGLTQQEGFEKRPAVGRSAAISINLSDGFRQSPETRGDKVKQ
jgi:glycosyltransferase involved in cell wall biosynthesis